MKFTIAAFFMGLMSLSAASTYSQNTKISLNLENATLIDVFKQIEAQSEFVFIYKNETINLDKKVDVKIEGATVDKILEKVLNNSDVKFEINNKQIIITPNREIPSNKNEKLIKEEIQQPQNKAISGTVKDSKGLSLPGVSVVVKGTTTGIVTDANGKFTLSVPMDAKTLIFSFVGMKAQEFAITGKTSFNVVMDEETVGLEEVVAIGYGVTRKSDLTGSIASVTSKDYDKQPTLNMTSALQGRAPGVSITNNSGAPGGLVKIRIRGANSITGGNDPLYVVDGIQLGSVGLQELNVNDIESFEVLKDASSTAIYGSRGANGVVMITTKHGKSGKAKIDFTTNFGISQRSYKYNTLDPLAYAELCNQATPGMYSDDQITKLKSGGGTDWQDELFQTAKSQDYQLSVSGATPKSSYFFSGHYLDQTGIIINTKYKQYAFRTNVESIVNEKLTIGASAFLSRGEGFNNQNQGGLNGAVQQSLIWGPAEPIFDADGSYQMTDAHGAVGKNPVAQQKNAFQNNITNSAILSAKLSYKIFDFLTLDIVGGMDAALNETDQVTTIYQAYGGVGASRIYNSAMNLQNSNILTFHKLFGDVHDLTVTGVYEVSKSKYDGTNATGGGMPFPDMLYYALQSNPSASISSYYGGSTLRSYLGRVNYVLKNKYLFTGTYRADGSSKFPNHKWGYFPSAAIGWRLFEEEFVKNLNLFSNLKLRASWGITGNQGVSPFVTIPLMNSSIYTYGTSVNQIGYGVSTTIGDPELKWEQTAQIDAGFDMGFFKNRLTLSADYFSKKTKDLLFSVPVPLYQGGGSKLSNVGEVENKGIELAIAGSPIETKDLSWNIGFNISSYKNKVVSLGGAEYIDGNIQGAIGNGIITTPPLRLIVGEPMGTFYGNKFLGIYQENNADIAEAALFGCKPGDSKYEDLNGDHKIDGSDRVIIGHALPKYVWGLDNTFRYKNFELNLFLQGVHGNDVLNVDYATAAMRVGDSRTITIAGEEHWTPENKNNLWPKLTSSTNVELPGSSRWLQDGSFVRIKNLSLAYHLPKDLIKETNLKLMISAQNLYTFTNYIGYDPEASTTGNSDIDAGVVMGAYPSARTFTFTIQLNF